MIAQAIHAAGESSPGNLESGTHAIALAARDSAHLAEIALKLTNADLPFVRVVEDSPPYRGELLAIGVQPGPRHVVGRPLSDLPLVREKRLALAPPIDEEADKVIDRLAQSRISSKRRPLRRGLLRRLKGFFGRKL